MFNITTTRACNFASARRPFPPKTRGALSEAKSFGEELISALPNIVPLQLCGQVSRWGRLNCALSACRARCGVNDNQSESLELRLSSGVRSDGIHLIGRLRDLRWPRLRARQTSTPASQRRTGRANRGIALTGPRANSGWRTPEEAARHMPHHRLCLSVISVPACVAQREAQHQDRAACRA